MLSLLQILLYKIYKLLYKFLNIKKKIFKKFIYYIVKVTQIVLINMFVYRYPVIWVVSPPLLMLYHLILILMLAFYFMLVFIIIWNLSNIC